MKKIFQIITCFLILFSLKTIYAQDSDKELFNLDALNFYTPDSTKSRLDVYVEFPFEKLEFQKSTDDKTLFLTNVELTIEIKDDIGNLVLSKLYKEDITTSRTDLDYLNKNSKIFTKNYYLQPGQYKLKVSAYERNTKKTSVVDKDVTVRDFLAQPITLSDVMVLSKFEESKNKKNITPDISRNVSDLDTFTIFLFVYRNNDAPGIIVDCKIRDLNKNIIFTSNYIIDSTQNIDSQNQVFIKVPVNILSFESYSVDITAQSDIFSSSISAGFRNISTDFPMSLKNIDLLIAQLQYIANEKEMSYLKAGKTDEEKRKRFIEFWKSKSMNQSVRKNKIMNEYYKRLDYANKHFSTPYSEGWRSDMGMVYIIMGLPSNIDRHPYNMVSKPYEVWDYYDINREFVFVDETGFGDYRLVTPIYDMNFRWQ